MQKYVPISAQFVNPFVSATALVFRTMLECEVKRGELHFKSDSQPIHEVSGIIGLSGKAAGTVVVSVSRQVALGLTETLTGTKSTDLDGTVVDAVGELANMVAGRAKCDLEQLQMKCSLPSVILGKNHSVSFPSQVTPICIPFESKWGSLCVEVGLVEQPA